MKILFPFTGDSLGGSHWSSIILMEGLKKANVEFFVVLHQRNNQLESILSNKGINFTYLQSKYVFGIEQKLSMLFFVFLELFSFRSFVKTHGIEIIHTNDNRMHIAWSLVSRFSNVKHVFHLRNKGLPGVFKKILTNFPSVYVYLSEFNGKDLENLRVRKHMVPNPIFCGEFKKPKALGETVCLGFVGNLLPRKRFDLFYGIAKRLNSVLPGRFVFKVYGKTFETDIESIKAEIPNMDFYGFITDVESIYEEIDILVATAENEPLGRTILESMANFVPVIAGNSGAHKELITKNNGILVEELSIESFCEAILDLISGKVDIRMQTELAYQYVKKNYSVDSSAKEIIGIYHEILE
jgi:glycosyltransferase involved in cell wall biosynthesis